jgi:hypothetical protein
MDLKNIILPEITILLPLLMFFYPAFLFADWQAFNPGLFTVFLPGPPRKIGGILEWVAVDSRKRAYNVTCKKLEDFPKDARSYFSQTLDDVAEGLRGRLDSHRFLKIEGNQVCEFKITTPQHVALGRMILAKPYLFSLEVVSGLKDCDLDPAGKFFDSFKRAPRTAAIQDSSANNPPSTQPW